MEFKNKFRIPIIWIMFHSSGEISTSIWHDYNSLNDGWEVLRATKIEMDEPNIGPFFSRVAFGLGMYPEKGLLRIDMPNNEESIFREIPLEYPSIEQLMANELYVILSKRLKLLEPHKISSVIFTQKSHPLNFNKIMAFFSWTTKVYLNSRLRYLPFEKWAFELRWNRDKEKGQLLVKLLHPDGFNVLLTPSFGGTKISYHT